MRIKRLNIKSFGKLKNVNLEFNPGLNIIYGPNEAGKSTIQHFIKAMLYGMNSQKKAIRENDRRRFLPWDNRRAEGVLVFEDNNNKEYVIDRSFGQVKKEDQSTVYNAITGEKAVHLDNNTPGKDLFGIGEDAFEKTLFIKQLGAKVAMDKEDEIMKRLTNINQTGEEDLSYNKAKAAMDNYKKTLKGSRKKGILEELEERIHILKEERAKLQILQLENIQDIELLNSFTAKIMDIGQEIENIQKEKSILKQSKIYFEAKDITERVKLLNSLNNTTEDLKSKIYQGDIKEAEDILEKLSEELWVYRDRAEGIKEQYEAGVTLKASILEVNKTMENYSGFKSLGEDIEIKLNNIENEKKEKEEKLKQIECLKEEVRALQNRSNYLQQQMGPLKAILSITSEEENALFSLEEKLKTLNYQLESSKLKDNAELKRQILKDKKNNSLFFIAAAVLLSLAGLWGVINSNIPGIFAGTMGILMFVYGFIQFKKVSQDLQALKSFESGDGNINRIKAEKSQIEEKISAAYSRYHVNSYPELKGNLDSCRSTISTLEGLKFRIEEKEREIEGLKENEISEALEKIKKNYSFLLSHCQCMDIGEFFEKLQVYKNLKLKLERIEEQYSNKLKEYESNLHNLQSIEDKIRTYISKFKIADLSLFKFSMELSQEENFGVYNNCFEAIKKEIRNIKEVELEAKTIEIKLNELLKGRSVEEIQKYVEEKSINIQQDILPEIGGREGIHYHYFDKQLEILDEKIGDLNEQLVNNRENKKDIEHRIDIRFKNKPSLWSVEEELQHCYEEKKRNEELYCSADTASAVLQEAFEEIQKNFAPKLNAEVGEIIKGITEGKYKEVRVATNYEIDVLEDNHLRELDFLSGGTFDQIYFALRLALCNIIFQDNAVPIILDDAFVQYDEERLNNAINYLKEYSKEHQVIVFTCRKIPGVNFITLG